MAAFNPIIWILGIALWVASIEFVRLLIWLI
jgi:hypothetical protein